MSYLRIYTIIIAAVVCFILLINLLLGIKHFSKFSGALKFLVIYLGVSFSAELLSLIYFVNGIPNIWVINLFTILEFVIIALFINRLIHDPEKKGVNPFSILTAIILLGLIGYFCFFKSIYEFSSYSETFENVALMGACIYYFVHALSNRLYCKAEEIKLTKWFVTTFFIYLSGILLIWLAYEFFLDKEEFVHFRSLMMYVNGFLNFSLKAVTLIALLSFDYNSRRKKILG